MSFIDEMQNLRSAIEDTKEKTARAVKEIKQDTRELLHEAQKLVDGFAEEQKERRREFAQAQAAFWGKQKEE